MTKPNDGGPAFPARPTEHLTSGASITAHNGMTLRDWFAGQALAMIPHMGCGADLTQGEVARCAYQIADDMIAAGEESK